MVIGGFQTLSLVDYPGKTCSIVFTQGCPFRCPFCHNPDLISSRPTATVAEESVLQYLADHKKMLDGVCITGGEPTVQPDLSRFISAVRALGLLVKLDTNGIHPNLIRDFVAKGMVDYLAMDLKNRWERYQEVIRAGGENTVDRCRETFRVIQESGVDHEFRTTVCPGVHTEDDFFVMASYLKPGETYFIQETQFKSVLDPNLSRELPVNVADLVSRLRLAYPSCQINGR